jgi:hypothetical protein
VSWQDFVAELRNRWPNPRITADAIRVYHRDLVEIGATPEQGLAALKALDDGDREFAPTPGTVRAKVMDLREPDPLDHGEAWRLAMESVRKFGSYREQEALEWLAAIDAALAYAVRTFGFIDLCRFDLRNETTVRAQFRDIYKNAAGRVARNRAAGGGVPALPPSEGGLRRLAARKFIAGVSGAPGPAELPAEAPDG